MTATILGYNRQQPGIFPRLSTHGKRRLPFSRSLVPV